MNAQFNRPPADKGGRLSRVVAHTVPVSVKTAWIIIEAVLADGISGFGEASLFGQEAAVLGEVAALNTALGDTGAGTVAPALALLDQVQMSPARGVLRTGLEGALFDALARRGGVPLTTLLGGPYRSGIACYANINRGIADRSADGFADRAAEVVALGYRAIKIAPFDGLRWTGDAGPMRARLEDGLARIGAVRERVGPDIDVLVDCHGRLNRAMALDVLVEAAPFGLFWVEDPIDLRRSQVDDQRAVRTAAHRSGTMIAGGEHIATIADATRLLADNGHDVVLPDLRETGIRQGIAILELCVQNGVQASLHNPAGPVLDALSRHVASALSSCLILERQVGESPLYDRLRGGAPSLADGVIALDDGAGLGFTPDRVTLAEAAKTPLAVADRFAGLGGAGPDA
ncbi:hypothetical protein L1787_25105 [Acuticoccus sp. M5D2P5]|uniref:enolase C-terminal domain-like protein n=1 Tax=Acuticoccus kalidii TaxID=2910977 RepID=UPI001F43E8C6|nr:enolase C-terminal domain-like protein [Acuticoccus kalidii]MCF3936674.1 hypothetical protein [Acuticoccus kalidii]